MLDCTSSADNHHAWVISVIIRRFWCSRYLQESFFSYFRFFHRDSMPSPIDCTKRVLRVHLSPTCPPCLKEKAGNLELVANVHNGISTPAITCHLVPEVYNDRRPIRNHIANRRHMRETPCCVKSALRDLPCPLIFSFYPHLIPRS